jgi:hypothetical protein
VLGSRVGGVGRSVRETALCADGTDCPNPGPAIVISVPMNAVVREWKMEAMLVCGIYLIF